jgi:hypothetical protein
VAHDVVQALLALDAVSSESDGQRIAETISAELSAAVAADAAHHEQMTRHKAAMEAQAALEAQHKAAFEAQAAFEASEAQAALEAQAKAEAERVARDARLKAEADAYVERKAEAARQLEEQERAASEEREVQAQLEIARTKTLGDAAVRIQAICRAFMERVYIKQARVYNMLPATDKACMVLQAALKRALYRPAFQQRLAASLALNAVGTRIGRGFLARRFVRRHRLLLIGVALQLQRIGRGFVHRRIYARLRAPLLAKAVAPSALAPKAVEAQALSSAAPAAATADESDAEANKVSAQMRAAEEEAANTRAAEAAEEAANMRAAEAAEKKKKKSEEEAAKKKKKSEEEAKKRKAEEEARTKKAAEEMAKKKAAEEVAKSTKEEKAADVDALSAEAPSPVEAHAASPVALAEGADAEPSFMSVAPTAQQGDDESPTPSEVVLPTTASAEDPAGPAIDSTDSDAAASLAEEANKADHRAHQMSPHEEEQNRLPINDVKLVPQLGDAAPQEEAVPLDEAVPLRVLLAQREAQPRPTEPSVLKKVCPLASNRSSQSLHACIGYRYRKQVS